MAIVVTPVVPRVSADRLATGFDVFRARYPDFLEEITLNRHHRDREMRKLRVLPEPDRHARVRKLLRDRRLHLFYAYDAMRKLDRLEKVTPAEIRALAEQCNPFSACRERIGVIWVPGKPRDRRVFSFGPRKRMQQALVADVIRALHPPLDSQKLFRGGMPKAFEAIEVAINEGYNFGAELDVVQFYASVRSTGLAKLLRPLPNAVVDHVVWDTVIRRNPDSDFMSMSSSDDPSLSGLVGLAPGAATSPIVGELIMSQFLTPSRAAKLAAYADNVFVLGVHRNAVLMCINHLREMAERLPTGPLRLRSGDIRDLREVSATSAIPQQFHFLHHMGEVRAIEPNGQATEPPTIKVCWSPDERKLDEYRLSEQVAEIKLEQIAEREVKIAHSRRAYPSWPNGDAAEYRYLGELAALRFYQTAKPLDRSRAAQAIMLYILAMNVPFEVAEILPEGRDKLQRKRRDELASIIADQFRNIASRYHNDIRSSPHGQSDA